MTPDSAHILIAEDSATQAAALQQLLSSEGYVCRVAAEGRAALEAARRHKPTLIISDIVMPEMDGYELCHTVKSDPNLSDVPVILLTALLSPEDVVRGLEAGADNFIRKPFESAHLLARIRHILLSRQIREESRFGVEIGVVLAGKEYRISAHRQQILDLLISTYEDAVRVNTELLESQARLYELTQQLEQRVQERTATAHAEVAERMRVEQSLRQVASIVESSEDAIFSTDARGAIRSWNPAAAALFGYTRNEALGQPAEGLLPTDARDFVRHSLALAQRGDAQKVECAVRTKEGKRVETAITVSPIRDADGMVVGISAIIRDLTVRRRLEDQVRQSQKLEAIGALAGGIAHDFNNLLSVILGCGELALLQPNIPDGLRAQLTQITEAGKRAASVTRQLLAFSRQQVLDSRVLDVNGVVGGLSKLLRRLIGENIELSTELEPALWRVKADATQLEQVVMNLAINARDAMPSGGRLTIRTSNASLEDSPPGLMPTAVHPGPYVVVEVSDSGVGISPEVQAHIFEPFFTTKPKDKGTGLGLSTVYGVVQQSGGSIKVTSEVGRGTKFSIYLPRTLEVEAQMSAAPQPPSDLGGGKTVLLVDDSEQLRELAREILERANYTVLTACDGADALARAKEHPADIHLLVTDVIMPGMSGIDLARALQPVRPETRVLYVSGYGADLPNRQKLPADGTTVLEKPYSAKQLLRKVREIIDRGTRVAQ